MKLSGVTFNTGTCALVGAVNYDHAGSLPKVRLSPGIIASMADRRSSTLEEHDEFLFLGRKAKEARHRFDVLAQIYTDPVAPLTEKSTPTAIQLQPFNLAEWDGHADFSAYIESHPNPMFE